MDISGVVAQVIHSMVNLNFVRTASWEVLCFIIWHLLFF
jgi:hypothetical protein